jgi:hypothetical protein
MIFLDDGERSLRGGRGRHSGAGGDEAQRVADHIGEDEAEHAGRIGEARQPAALELREPLADDIDFVNSRAGKQ